jgi:hypothetical protein
MLSVLALPPSPVALRASASPIEGEAERGILRITSPLAGEVAPKGRVRGKYYVAS